MRGQLLKLAISCVFSKLENFKLKFKHSANEDLLKNAQSTLQNKLPAKI